MSDRVCTNCIFCRQEDYGYSNWTVEGTTVSCLFGLIGQYEGTSFPNEAEKIAQERAASVAENCKTFRAGTGLYFDCDREVVGANIAAWVDQYIKP